MINFKFLRDCVRALREYDNPYGFGMTSVFTCVAGHYASWRTGYAPDSLNPDWMHLANDVLCREGFHGLDGRRRLQLFGAFGCGGATTKEEAIEYLERFIEKHEIRDAHSGVSVGRRLFERAVAALRGMEEEVCG